MPIIEAHNDDAPLCQGDILSNITLYATAAPWDGGGQPKKHPSSLCLILSRPCNVLHKQVAIVSAVDKYQDNIPAKVDSFDELLGFFMQMRDGDGSADRFYLGQIPGQNGRFCCRFDSLFSVELPNDDAIRQQFVRRHRVGTLNHEFARDLHQRIFRAFAMLGFDDIGWFSDADLEYLVAKGQSDLNVLQQKVSEAETAIHHRRSKGETVSSAHEEQLRKQQDAHRAFQLRLQPFVDELERRRTAVT